MNELADEVWATMTALVMDSRGDWRRRAAETAGLPFSRVRVLRRLAAGPMSLRDLADSAAMDAPAVTVALNDLEERGLVTRSVSPESRRCKDVSLTAEGRAVVGRVDRIRDAAPAALRELDPGELTTLHELLKRLGVAVR
jgi:DNA-binding MarR family transcriptional regulator